MLKGILYVLLGAASYGVLATIVKLSYQQGFNVSEVTFAQYSVGLLVLWMLTLLPKKSNTALSTPKKWDVSKLILAGTSLGFTGLFYYSAVQTIDVSICIVLLMQSVWMGVLLEALLENKLPNTLKIIAVGIVLAGTIFATDAIHNFSSLDPTGLLWGILAALSYTVSLYTSNRVGLSLNNGLRSALMMSGAWVLVASFALYNWHPDFNWSVFWPWGVYLALFGTIIPPIFLNKGFPLTGIGIGSILVSLEIPVSVGMAVWLLNEEVNLFQIIGIALILLGILVLNLKRNKARVSNKS
jgi:drug/metabolite transporter (DMT)-like permease